MCIPRLFVPLTLIVSLLAAFHSVSLHAEDCPLGQCDSKAACQAGCSAQAGATQCSSSKCELQATSSGCDSAHATACDSEDVCTSQGTRETKSAAAVSLHAGNPFDRQRRIQRDWGTLINDLHLRHVSHEQAARSTDACETKSTCVKACTAEACESAGCNQAGSCCKSTNGAADITFESTTAGCPDACCRQKSAIHVQPNEAASVILELMESLGQGVLDGTEFQAVCADHPACQHPPTDQTGSREAIVRFIRALEEERAHHQISLEELPPPPTPDVDPTEIERRVSTLRQASAVLDQVSSDLEAQDLYVGADHVRGLAHSLRHEARELQHIGLVWSTPAAPEAPVAAKPHPRHPVSVREAMKRRFYGE